MDPPSWQDLIRSVLETLRTRDGTRPPSYTAHATSTAERITRFLVPSLRHGGILWDRIKSSFEVDRSGAGGALGTVQINCPAFLALSSSWVALKHPWRTSDGSGGTSGTLEARETNVNVSISRTIHTGVTCRAIHRMSTHGRGMVPGEARGG